MKINFLPKTSYGKWSGRFLLAFLSLYMLSIILVTLSVRLAGETATLNPAFSPFLAVSGILALISGISAFVFGVLSIIKQKERSVSAFLALLLGVIVLIFIAGEILLPH